MVYGEAHSRCYVMCLASQWEDLSYPSVDDRRITHASENYSRNKRNFLWRTSVFLFLVLGSYFSWRRRERSTSTIWSWPTSCAHSTSIPRLWWLPPRWVRSRAEPLPPNIIFRAVFSFRHFCPSHIPRHISSFPMPLRRKLRQIDRRKLSPCCVSTKHFLLQIYRCSLHLQQPHSLSIIPPYIVRCFIFVSGSIDHWPWRLLGIETVRHLILSNVACVEFLNGGLAAVQMGIVSGKRKASIHFPVLLALAFCSRISFWDYFCAVRSGFTY